MPNKETNLCAIRSSFDCRYRFSRYFSPIKFNRPTAYETLVAKNDLELYDLQQDPDETRNLAGRHGHERAGDGSERDFERTDRRGGWRGRRQVTAAPTWLLVPAAALTPSATGRPDIRHFRITLGTLGTSTPAQSGILPRPIRHRYLALANVWRRVPLNLYGMGFRQA